MNEGGLGMMRSGSLGSDSDMMAPGSLGDQDSAEDLSMKGSVHEAFPGMDSLPGSVVQIFKYIQYGCIEERLYSNIYNMDV